MTPPELAAKYLFVDLVVCLTFYTFGKISLLEELGKYPESGSMRTVGGH
jgi:hypothetical protein